jgi:hypothetical protein
VTVLAPPLMFWPCHVMVSVYVVATVATYDTASALAVVSSECTLPETLAAPAAVSVAARLEGGALFTGLPLASYSRTLKTAAAPAVAEESPLPLAVHWAADTAPDAAQVT